MMSAIGIQETMLFRRLFLTITAIVWVGGGFCSHGASTGRGGGGGRYLRIGATADDGDDADHADTFDGGSYTTSTVPITTRARYSCKFVGLWTEARHPIMYPGDDAHFSPMILVGHSSMYELWEPGTRASPGVEETAEIGGTELMLANIKKAGNKANRPVVGEVQFVSDFTSQVLPNVAVDSKHPYLSAIHMVAPSPDWFSGFRNYDARDLEKKVWKQSFKLDTYPHDAGSEDGRRFDTENTPTNPRGVIKQLSIHTIPDTKVFSSPDKKTVLPVARWECSLKR